MELSKPRRRTGAIFTSAALIALALLAPAAMGGGAPSLAWSPTNSVGAFDYGAVQLGHSTSQVFTLTNSGGSATAALNVSIAGSSAFSITSGCTPTSLGRKKSCTVTVEYTPSSSGRTDAAMLSATGKKAGADASITLRGRGAGVPDLALSPGTLTGTTTTGTKLYTAVFGPCLCGPDTQTFTVTNNGTGSTGTLSVEACCTPQFFWANDTCTGATLAPSESCLFELTFNGGCGPGDEFHTPLDIVGTPESVKYIHLEADAFC